MVKQNKKFLPYLLGNSEEEATQTFLDYQNLLNKMAYSYSETTGIDKGDLFGEAVIGLAKAKRDYDINKASLFTYAFMVITDTLNDYTRRNSMIVSLPVYVKKAHSIIERIKGLLNPYNLIFEVVITESSENIPEDIKVNYDYLVEKLNNAADRASIDIKELIKRAEFIPISAKFEEDKLEIETAASSEALVSELKTLMTDEEWFISQGIMEGKTYDEIGAELGISGSAIGQKFNALKIKIKHEMGED